MALAILRRVKALFVIKASPVCRNRPKDHVLDVTSLVKRLDEQFNLGLDSACNNNNRQNLLIKISLAIRLKPQALNLLNKEGPLTLKEVNKFLKKIGFEISQMGECYRLHPLSRPGLIIN
jgi:hypothetical protein